MSFRRIVAVLLLCALAGCRAQSKLPSVTANDRTPSERVDAERSDPVRERPSASESAIRQIAGEQDPAPVPVAGTIPAGDDPLDGAAVLDLAALVLAVEQRNPSLEGMVAAWQAAAKRYPQVIALDDPMFQTMIAPASLGSSDVEPAYAVQLSQKFPWHGKRAIRGQVSSAEANAAYYDSEDARVRLAEATRLAFFDYYLARRQFELNVENRRVMTEFRNSAVAKLEANQVTQQDVLQADVELADLERRHIEIDRAQRIAAARINTLLRNRPNAALPPPPRRLAPPTPLPPLETLEASAFERRPDLSALQSRVDAECAAVQLALKQFHPDIEIFGRYDSFWQPESTQRDLRGQVGVNLNLPVYRGKLHAAVDEALFRLNQRRAELEQRKLDVQYDLSAAYEQLDESRRTVQLYDERIIPAARQSVAAARANYEAARSTFLNLAESERKLIELQERQQEAIADYHRRSAQLERTLAGPVSTAIPPAP